MEVTILGLDIAKRVFQLHGVDIAGKAVLRRKLQRAEVLAFFKALPPCLVGIEACGTAHYWTREIRGVGHEVRLMPPSGVMANRSNPGPGRTRQAFCAIERANLFGSQAADCIRASGHGPRNVGRTHDRTRPRRQMSDRPCFDGVVHA
jgi:transposase